MAGNRSIDLTLNILFLAALEGHSSFANAYFSEKNKSILNDLAKNTRNKTRNHVTGS